MRKDKTHQLVTALIPVFILATLLGCSQSSNIQSPADFLPPLSESNLTFMEGNDCTQSVVGVVPAGSDLLIKAGSASGFQNDEARSVLISDVPVNTVVRVFDSPNGNTSDDWAEITIKSSVKNQCVATFEENLRGDSFTLVYHAVNGLDGKVSRVEILSIPTEIVKTPSRTSSPDISINPDATNTVTASPTIIEQTVTTSSTPVPIPTSQPAGLPGLMPADITVNLQQKGFECTNADSIDNSFVWACSRQAADVLLRVEIYSNSLLAVDTLDASAIFFGNPDDDLASEFLGFLATLPYDGAQPDAARQWVESNLPTIREEGDVRDTSFGGVNFRLFGIPTARSLLMGFIDE
jgi:hypothetical protein